MNIDEQLKQILKFGEGEPFFSFANADGKRWLMPARNIRTAMNLYQPSGPKGKLVKQGLPWLYWNPVVLHLLHAERLRLALSDELRALLEHVFEVQNPEFSIFCGTPCVHQKITLQISCGSRIVGYVKVTASEAIREVFEHERLILSTLHDKGIDQVPRCLYCGALSCGLHVFIQTTQKTAHSRVIHCWEAMHSRFLDRLAMQTRQTALFEQTDFCCDLRRLEGRLSQLPGASIVEKAMAEVRYYYAGREVEFSAFQADFTPWNMFEEGGELFVFDWEYARLTYPPRLDYFHFRIQTSIFEQHLPADVICAGFEADGDRLNGIYGGDYRFPLKCYLLAVISLYVNRESGTISRDTYSRLAFWVKILEQLENSDL